MHLAVHHLITIMDYSPVPNVLSNEFSGLLYKFSYGQQMTVNNSIVNKLPTT